MADERGLSASWCVVAALTLPLGALAQESPPAAASSRSTPTPPTTRSRRRWRRTPTATSSWSGRATARTATHYGVFARRFSSAGAAWAVEFQVNAYTRATSASRGGVDADGDFVVVWQQPRQDGSDYGIFARRFSSAGAALATEFQVNTYTTGNQLYPSVAAAADGDFVVAWQSASRTAELGIFAQRFSSAGAA